MPDVAPTSNVDAPLPAGPALSAGARVTAHLMQGDVLEGRLESYSERDGLRLACAGDGSTEIPLRQLRYLLVVDPLHEGKAAFSGDPQRFTLTYVDGKEFAGVAFGLTADPEGLRVYVRNANGNQHLMIVPNRSLRRYRVGPLLGESLVAAKAVAPGDVEAALKVQEAQRARKLGVYLHSTVALTAEDLKQAIEEQANVPVRKLGEVLMAEGLISVKQLAHGYCQVNCRCATMGE